MVCLDGLPGWSAWMIDHYVSRDGLERTEVINMRSETADRFSGQ